MHCSTLDGCLDSQTVASVESVLCVCVCVWACVCVLFLSF
jgi:hypothetical protein